MELLNNFGFEPVLFIAQIVNFLIIFLLMKKFLYAPLVKMLEDRKHKIAEGLRQADASAKLMEETIRKEEMILKKAQEDARKLIDEAKAQQASIMQQTEEATKARVDKMLNDAREQISFESIQAEKRLTSHVSKIAVQFLQEAVQGIFGPQDQELIMKNAIKKLSKKVD
jgi:F-type H+-transporting ATPase subunit b